MKVGCTGGRVAHARHDLVEAEAPGHRFVGTRELAWSANRGDGLELRDLVSQGDSERGTQAHSDDGSIRIVIRHVTEPVAVLAYDKRQALGGCPDFPHFVAG